MTPENERYGMIRLFEATIASLALLCEHDKQVFTWKRRRIPLSHCLANHLKTYLSSRTDHQGFATGMYIDMCVPVGTALVPDILVHNRNTLAPARDLAIVCRDDYLSEQELKELHDLKTAAECELTLAVAFLPQKEYLLLYRADEGRIDYYHFLTATYHCQLLKRRDLSELSTDRRQLKLGMKLS